MTQPDPNQAESLFSMVEQAGVIVSSWAGIRQAFMTQGFSPQAAEDLTVGFIKLLVINQIERVHYLIRGTHPPEEGTT